MTTTTRIKWTLSGIALATLGACSGGSNSPNNPPATSTRLDYTNPTSGTYLLVKDATSTTTHLVLNLMGPAGTFTTGLGFILNADSSKVTWSKPASTDTILAHNSLFDLGTAPQLAVAKSSGNQLQVGFYQKGTTKPVVTLTAASILASVAVDLNPNVPLGAVTFSAISGKAVLINGTAIPAAMVISTGTLTAN